MAADDLTVWVARHAPGEPKRAFDEVARSGDVHEVRALRDALERAGHRVVVTTDRREPGTY